VKRLSILFFLLALLLAGVTIAAVFVRANNALTSRSAPASASPVTGLSSL
jgi:hypothetical protein